MPKTFASYRSAVILSTDPLIGLTLELASTAGRSTGPL